MYITVYSAEFAMAFCEGVVEIEDIEDFFINEHPMDQITEEADAISLDITYYPGNDTQLIDPVIQAWYDVL